MFAVSEMKVRLRRQHCEPQVYRNLAGPAHTRQAAHSNRKSGRAASYTGTYADFAFMYRPDGCIAGWRVRRRCRQGWDYQDIAEDV